MTAVAGASGYAIAHERGVGARAVHHRDVQSGTEIDGLRGVKIALRIAFEPEGFVFRALRAGG